MEVSGAFLAGLLEVNERTIQRWAKSQVIARVGVDRYDLESAVGYVLGDLRSQIEGLKNSSVDNPESLPARKLLAECRKLEAEAGKKEIELEQLKGDLLPRKEAEEDFIDCFSKVKAKFSSLPRVACDRLAGMDDSRVIERYLESLTDEALKELSDNFRDSVVEVDLDWDS
jgi:hypothetical protein